MKPRIQHYKDKEKHPERESSRELLVKTDKDAAKPAPKYLKSLLVFSGALVIIIILILFSWIDFARRPVSETQTDYQYFEAQIGKSSRSIGYDLEKAGLVRSGFAFFISARLEGATLQAGHYKLSPSMGMDEIIAKLEKGEVDAFSVTIPEGYRVLQIAKTLEEKGINVFKFIDAATGTEGTLFPDTYVFPTNIEESKIVRQMKENYEKKVATLRPTQEQLILASIIEREAKKDDERAKIAAVYKNRADNNMLLQADPTVRYALDTQEYLKNHSVNFQFWQSITKNDYQSLSSAYNTYKQKGYPPAPICNPGIKSIEAAINPAKDFGEYFYFFHDAAGEIHFSKTLAEHTSQIQQFGVSG